MLDTNFFGNRTSLGITKEYEGGSTIGLKDLFRECFETEYMLRKGYLASFERTALH